MGKCPAPDTEQVALAPAWASLALNGTGEEASESFRATDNRLAVTKERM